MCKKRSVAVLCSCCRLSDHLNSEAMPLPADYGLEENMTDPNTKAGSTEQGLSRPWRAYLLSPALVLSLAEFLAGKAYLRAKQKGVEHGILEQDGNFLMMCLSCMAYFLSFWNFVYATVKTCPSMSAKSSTLMSIAFKQFNLNC